MQVLAMIHAHQPPTQAACCNIDESGGLSELYAHSHVGQVVCGQPPYQPASILLYQLLHLNVTAYHQQSCDQNFSAYMQKCGMASTIIGMLVDVNLFWEYDNRETLMQRDKEEQGN